MNTKALGIILTAILIMAPTARAARTKQIDLAVKRGQQTVDAKKLPFACLTFVLQGQPMFLNNFEVQSLETKQEFQIECVHSQQDPRKTELLTANQGKDRSLTMAIFPLSPGRYRLRIAHFTYPGRDGALMNGTFFFYDQDFVFTVMADAANYLGSLVLSADWTSADRQLAVKHIAENSVKRDLRWASDMVPGMAKVPSVDSPLEIQSRSP